LDLVKNIMSSFNLKSKKDGEYFLLKNNNFYTTNKGSRIVLRKLKENNKFLEKIKHECSLKESSFLKLLFYSSDLDKKNIEVISNKILNYIDTDLVCFREKPGSEIEKLQSQQWSHYLDFCKEKFLLEFNLNYSIFPIKQNKSNNVKILSIMKRMNNHHFIAFYFLVELTSSIIISLNLLFNNLNYEEIWNDINLEYEFNQKKYGVDEELKNNLLLKKVFFSDIISFISFFNKE